MSGEEVYTVFEMTLRRYQLKINKRKNRPGKESLHNSLRYILTLSQCFGVLPCRGVLELESAKLRFDVFSLRVLWSMVVLCFHLFMSTMAVRDVVDIGLHLRTCNVMMIYTTGLIIHILYIRLGVNWPKLMQQWSKLESLMSDYGYPKRLSRKIRVVNIFALLVILFEYILSIWHAIHHVYMYEAPDADVLKELYKLQFSFVHDYLEYSKLLAIFVLICNFICMFVWNINDLLIVVVSIALAARFKQIKDKIILTRRHRENYEKSWKRLREDYNHIVDLYHYLESAISYTVLVSFASNLYFILIQLFQTLHENHSGVGNIYFFSSFGMLVLRTFTVTLFAAQINENSKELLFHLTQIPTEIYTTEVEWLMLQISHIPIALTGCQLFRITRRVVFTIASTIVTYELFLFQFDLSLHVNSSTADTANLTILETFSILNIC